METTHKSEQTMFVDEHINIQVGLQAQRALESVTDERYLSTGNGIVSVPRDRWQTAQAYERQTWMVKGSHASEDRNLDHLDQFDGYQSLKGHVFRRAIELGCGPFTNLKYIMRNCRIQRCSLLDPLATSYIEHRHCSYKGKFLIGEQTPLFGKLSGTVFHRGVRRLIKRVAPGFLFKTVPLDEVISKPIEEMVVRDKYDLIVIINVIEHCYDANVIFEKIKEMANKGAILVFHDKYYYHDQVSQDVKRIYDAGHPLRVDRVVVDDFLDKNFNTIYKKMGRKESIVEGVDLGHDTVYFIGQLR